jgi:polysaccharide biosynthesis/export protein
VLSRIVHSAIAFLLASSLVAVSQQTRPNGPAPSINPSPPATTGTNNPSPDEELRIGPGDLLEVSVFEVQDYTRQVRVSPQGEIMLPMIGAVKVAGLSVKAAEEVVAKKLAEGGYFNNPQVSILTREYATQGVSVLGEVQKPGIYPLLGPHTLLNVISAAGGTTPKAGMTVTITHANAPSKPETAKISYSADGKPTEANSPVYPGDIVVVSKAGIVYVVGDVHAPSGIIMDKPQITVLQALAMAQGVNPGASLNSTTLIRRTSDGPKQIPVPLKKILSAQAADVALQPDDILFVPASAAKALGKKTLETALQVATGVAIYRP